MKILYRPARPKAYRNPRYVPEGMTEGKVMSRQVRRQLQRRALKMFAERRQNRQLG